MGTAGVPTSGNDSTLLGVHCSGTFKQRLHDAFHGVGWEGSAGCDDAVMVADNVECDPDRRNVTGALDDISFENELRIGTVRRLINSCKSNGIGGHGVRPACRTQ